MRKALSYILWSLFFASVYMVLNEAFNIYVAIVGFVLSLLSILIADKVMLDKPFVSFFRLRPFYFLRYGFYLIYRIILAGLGTMVLSLKSNVQVRYFCYNSNLHDDFLNNVLANSITLTPGTVTVDKEGDKLTIMQLVAQDKAPDMESIAKFEEIIKPIRRISA